MDKRLLILDMIGKAKQNIDKAYNLLNEECGIQVGNKFDSCYSKWNTREHLIFGEDYKPENYGSRGSLTRRFEGLSLNTAEVLIKQGFLDPEETQNESPTVAEFIEFVKDHPDGNFTFYGYVVGPERDDCRVSFEGIEGISDKLSKDTIVDFSKMFIANYHADGIEIEENRLYCWYD